MGFTNKATGKTGDRTNMNIQTGMSTQTADTTQTQDGREYFETNDAFVRTAVRRYMAPSVLALIGTTVTTVANSVIIGNCIGAGGLAALNIVNPIYFTFATLGALINVGASTNASVCMGKNEKDRAKSYAALALWLTLACSVIITVTGMMFFPYLIKALGATESIRLYAEEYGRIQFSEGGRTSQTGNLYVPADARCRSLIQRPLCRDIGPGNAGHGACLCIEYALRG